MLLAQVCVLANLRYPEWFIIAVAARDLGARCPAASAVSGSKVFVQLAHYAGPAREFSVLLEH